MSQSSISAPLPNHPSPHRDRVALAGLAFGLVGGPLAWIVQFCVNFGLASHACFPHDVSHNRPQAGWEHVGSAVLAINLAAMVVALAAVVVAWLDWRATRYEHAGGPDHLLDVGEGRSRFLGICGVMTGLGSLLAIAVNTVAVFMVPPCAG
jgi:hypothetical protein